MTIAEIDLNECPKSLITEESIEHIDTYQRARRMKVALYGPNLSEWPVWAVDAMTTLDAERARADQALHIVRDFDDG